MGLEYGYCFYAKLACPTLPAHVRVKWSRKLQLDALNINSVAHKPWYPESLIVSLRVEGTSNSIPLPRSFNPETSALRVDSTNPNLPPSTQTHPYHPNPHCFRNRVLLCGPLRTCNLHFPSIFFSWLRPLCFPRSQSRGYYNGSAAPTISQPPATAPCLKPYTPGNATFASFPSGCVFG